MLSVSQSAPSQIDELDRPRAIKALAAWLQAHGEDVSHHWLWRTIRSGKMPAARVGRMTSTARAYYTARSPKAVL